MCGGKGTRLESPHEKPLHPIDGDPMVDRVLGALRESRIEAIHAAVSPNAPETRSHLESVDGVATIETPGDGYVADLLAVLDRSEIEPPVLTVAADLPLLEAAVVDRVLAARGDGGASRTVCVPAALKRRLGVSIDARLEPEDHLAPTGVNVVGDPDDTTTMTDVYYDSRLAVNVNRLEDARLATELLRDRRTEPVTTTESETSSDAETDAEER
ncbi:NTP transferase domain-containing protein [Natrinema salifodinae]|uniref:Adenosylcobinamide-phosphate guanylyltransferase n=1 Tax=Natrinema salifodinae TaxID=1202768 RepID=A0A1I0PE35_9EURY|nr:NTP transferase domain-containing protein [Natrinema salifodinae]SEW11874.1 adenosylcobinamide-phosphate guanylyltransferase [Natrinema salifodinae]